MVHCIIGAGTEESAMSKKKKRPHGHCCKICGEYKADEKFFGKEDFFMEDLKNGLEVQPTKEPKGNPSWRVQVEYTNHTEQDICSYEN